ncbi:MAG TPA: hypothetical protein VH309_13745 [Elusimicrobiota bacterium]|jgi:hypothetical protein|nr:hypothetical protein [Elusimicrobiota bacterium]
MKLRGSNRAWTALGFAALVLTAGAMARRRAVAAAKAPEELRDAVASPALAAGALRPPWAFAVRPERPVERPLLSERLARLADALDARAARLRRAAR